MRVTITGFDQWFAATDLVKLHRLERTVDVEFAALLGPGTGREPRYPAPSVIEAFAAFTERGGIPSALHVCGPLAREALRDPCPERSWRDSPRSSGESRSTAARKTWRGCCGSRTGSTEA